MTRSILNVLLTAATLLFSQDACAQDKDARRAEIDKQLGKEMSALTRTASGQKFHTLAREVAQLIVDHYAPNNGTVRRILGMRKVRGSWQQDKPIDSLPQDNVTGRNQKRLADKWNELKKRAGAMHRTLGLKMRGEGGDAKASEQELRLALVYLPDDARCNEALGRTGYAGFWGKQAEVDFAKRMQELLGKANELSQADYKVEEIPQSELPIELKQTGMTFVGARGPRYAYWMTDSFEAAENCVVWSERCHDFLAHLLGDDAKKIRHDGWKWHCILRSEEERDALLTKSPSTRGPFPLDQAQLFAGIGFALEAGGRAAATWQGKELDNDYAVANVTKRHLLDQRNEGLGEGLTHVTTWLLCESTQTYFADLPKTVSAGETLMPRDPKAWYERLMVEIDEGRDHPLVQVPRERADNFRDSTRLKSWSFMFWMLARHPDKWLELIDKCGSVRVDDTHVVETFKKVLGQPLEDVEAEWRNWARRGSKLGRASGWHQ